MSIEAPDFADFATDPEDWYFVATDLIAAAEALEPSIQRYWRIEHERSRKRKASAGCRVFMHEPDPRGIHFMLMAYALENLCKSIIMLKGGEQIKRDVSKEGRLPKKVVTHDLSRLLREIGFELSEDDLELANRLERSAVWSARYPVPVRENHRTVFAKKVQGKEEWPVWHDEDDLENAKDLGRRLVKFLAKERGYDG